MRTIEVVMAQIPNGGSNLLYLALARIAGQNTIVGICSRLTARDTVCFYSIEIGKKLSRTFDNVFHV